MENTAAVAAVAASAPFSGLSPMQTELLSRADSILAGVSSAVSKASDLAIQGGKAVAEQIPDIAIQYVAFGRAASFFEIVVAITFMAVGIWAAVRYGFHDHQEAGADRDGDWRTSRVIALVAGSISIIVGFIIMCSNMKDFLMVWFAPKVWLLLELANLIKQVRS